jgi:C-terminal processing protease CtpA/Prc
LQYELKQVCHFRHLSPTGGSAEKNGQLHAGDELLNVNGSDVTVLSRIEAWGLMKRLPDGPVSLTIRHRLKK